MWKKKGNNNSVFWFSRAGHFILFEQPQTRLCSVAKWGFREFSFFVKCNLKRGVSHLLLYLERDNSCYQVSIWFNSWLTNCQNSVAWEFKKCKISVAKLIFWKVLKFWEKKTKIWQQTYENLMCFTSFFTTWLTH